MAETAAVLGALSTDRQELLRRLLEKKGVQASRVERIPRRPDPDVPAPLSFSQQRLWLLDRLEPGTALYNVPAAIRVRAEILPWALLYALGEVVRRHESLRTTFVEIDGEPRQLVGPPFVPPLSLYDLSALPDERRLAELAWLLDREARGPFDLARGPLVRALLVRLGENDCVVAVTMHHIVSDGWSGAVLLRELVTIGRNHAWGQPAGLPEPPIQYADFAVWQRGQMTGETLASQLAFWRQSLAGIPESLELPFDRPRPAAPSGRGGRRRLTVKAEVAGLLRDLAGREGTTLFAVLLAGFQALLGRLADQEELAVGTVNANRNREEVEELIGFFVNTLTFPARLGGDPSFAELVRRSKETTHGAFAHQDLPFERLVEELAPDRVVGRNPLFQVAFAFQNLLGPRRGSVKLDTLAIETGTAKFDLGLSLVEDDGALLGDLEYAADLFDPTTAARYCGYLENLLAGAAAQPETPFSALPLLGEAELHQLVLDWNDTAVAPVGLAGARSIPEAVAAQVRQVPDRVAVAGGEAQLSYGELAARAGRLAADLVRLGVGPEVTVGVYLERSPELVIVLLGIIEAGGAYVPLDLDYPEARLAFMLEAAGARLVVTEERFAGRPALQDFGASARTETLSPAGRPEPEERSERSLLALVASPPSPALPSLPLEGANLVYIPFTSGSTGQPKGVALSHRNALRLIREGEYAHFGPEERFLLVAPISFDPSTAEIWGALAHGARLALLPPGIPSLDGLAGVLADHGITILWLSAGLFHEVVDGRIEMLAGVRQLMAGGDTVSPSHVRRAVAALPDLRLTDSYGPTEVTTFTSCFPIDLRAVAQTVPIGRPIGNTRVHVLDRSLRPAPIGVPGELLAGGAGLARGYIGRPDLTAERFIPDGVSGLSGERLYRTGDRVRTTALGLIEFLGRFDDQVKVRGFRIEPSEVEAVLSGCPGVAQAAVLATPPKAGESRRLVGFVAAAEGAVVEPATLSAWLAARLPDYMVPGAFMVLPSLPIAPTGKVDRRALLGRVAEAVAAGSAPAGSIPLRTPTEELMAAVWAEVLGVPVVGAGDGFFALGGHSLLATRAAARVRDVFGVELPLRHFFEATDLADLSARLDRLRGSGATLDFPPITRRPAGEPAPLSFSQERLWFLDRLTPDAAIYNVPEVKRFHGPLSADLLGQSLAVLAGRHEILRSRFAADEAGQPVQIVDPVPETLLSLVDLTGLPHPVAVGEMQLWSWHEAFRPFDLARSPLVRARLFRLDAEDHAWVVVHHHIATDGWSSEIFHRELATAYGALAAGMPLPLPELPVQYADFAAWQRRHLSPEILEGQLAYWRGKLAGAPPLLDLPADHPRPPEQQFAGAIRSRTLPDELAARLLALGRRFGATRYMVLLAAFKALLARYTGRTDLLVGTPVANRRRAEVQELIGFFANTLVLRTDLAGDPAFSELLLKVRGTALAAYDHQDLPFERLVEELNPVRDPSYPALAQVLFVQQGRNRRDADEGGEAGAAVGLSRVEGDRALSRFDVELYVFEVGEGLELALEYRIDLFDAPRMERMLGHLETLLIGVAENPALRLSAVPLLSPAEHQQILAEWGEGLWEEIFGGPFLHELFEARARLEPEAPALVVMAGAEPLRLTYGELDEASDRLAAELAGRGIGRGDRVGIMTRRDAGLIAGLLGILKAGAIYVPLDPAYPESRLSRIAADAELSALLVGEGVEGILVEVEAPRMALTGAGSGEGPHPLGPPLPDTPSPAPGEGEGERGTVRLSPDDLAYLIYTSGSTGTPKGVAIRHGSAAAMVRWAVRAFSRGELARVLAGTSVNFDLSVFEIFVPLAVGGTVVLVEDALALPGLTEEVTLINTVPSVLAEVLKGRLPAAPEAGWTVNLAGEPLRRELADPILALPGVRRLWNLYGPSEDTTYSTGAKVPAGTSEEPTIGRALSGTRALLLDAFGATAPVGVPGELCLGGAGLARGYWRRGDLTAERFIPDPQPLHPGERLYRTGDLVRWLPGGEMQFLGRIDHQVKVRGFRIELSEIEIALSTHPEVGQAAVLALGEGADRRLVAFVSPAQLSAPELRAYLRESLPDYMVPASFVPLAALPLSPNGKVDRKVLASLGEAAPGEALVASAAGHRLPEGPIEIGVASIWSDLLHRHEIGRDDNFFDLGGHSLQGVRLISRVHETFGVELALRTIFEAPTLTGLAARIEQALTEQLGGGERKTRRPIPRLEDRSGPIPLSFSQERLWFLEQLEPGTPFYNIPAALRFAGPFEPALLQAAVTDLLTRHESLRTLFGDDDGRPYQKIGEPEPIPVPVIDLTGLPEPVRPYELGYQVREESRRPFDLVRGPLLRVVVIKVAPEDQVVAHTVHHIVSDGWSSGILMREIGLFYGARVAGIAAPLPPLPIQYADYAAWQRQVLSGDSLANLLAYWRGRLAGCRGIELPLDRPRPAVETFRGANRSVVVPPERARPVSALARRSGATLFMVLLAAFKATVFRYTGQADVPVGSPIANRGRRELEGVVGFFANTLVLRTDLSGDPTFAELLARIKEVTLGGYAHEDLPFERLVEEVQPERDMSRNPLFQIMLVLQNQPREGGTAGEGVATTALAVDSGTAKFDLTIFWSEMGDALLGLLEHNSDLFDASTALRFYTHYENLMVAATTAPETRLSELELLSAAERHQMAAEWNATGTGRPLRPVHLLVTERARAIPGEIAAVYGERILTYGELEERANRMAHGLRKLGVRPEARVGVSLERSLSMVIAALAVQKAGGALVALDTAYPVERLARIIDDAGLTLLLTDEAQLARFPGREGIALLLDDAREPFPDEPATPPAVALDLDHPMYVIYTSGTTGQPKGIAVPHRAFANLLGWQLASAPIAPGSRTVQFAAFGFCVSFQEIFTSWVSGGTLVVAAERVRRDVEELGGFLAQEGVERLHLPFAALKALSEGVEGVEGAEGAEGALPATINEVITAGEQLRVTPAVRALFGAGDRASLANQYGASETHVVAAHVLTGDPLSWPAIPPVGRPIDNVRIHLLDPQLSPVARLVRGELYAGGDCLPRCYLNDPALTAAKLVPDPFGEPGARLYRTGDAARYLADGTIEHLGRLDSQVKVRGFRVELGEVDTALARHPSVRDCAVVAFPGTDGSRLVAYVVPESGAALETEELRAHLKELLPDFMVPAAFVALHVLPVNANGKLDQAALPEPDFTRRAVGAYAAPEGPVAEVVAAIWGDVLGIAQVSAEDDFFDLGGHSLLATQVISRLRAAFSVDLPVRALFEASTVTALAKRVEEMKRQVAGLTSLPLTALPRTGPPSLSFAQERLWFLDRLEGGGNPAYNMPIAVRFMGPLSAPSLSRALDEIVRRHEALRTVFASSPEGPVQIVRRATSLNVPRIDLSALPPERLGMELADLISAESRRPFDLARGPLFRPLLFTLAAEDHALSANTHHIVSDGWSLGVLLSELTALYAAFVDGEPSPLPPLPIQYGDFALWQRRWLAGEILDSEVEHWRGKLSRLNLLLEIPADYPRPPVKTTAGAVRSVWLDPHITDGLKRVARQNGATLFMSLLTAFETLLYRLSGEERFALGTPIANRNRLETESLIGFFVNTLVLAADLAGEPTFAAAVAVAREDTLAAYTHQDLPFEKIVEEVKPPRSLAHTPIFQILFALQTQDTTKALSPHGEMAPGLVLNTLNAESGTAKFDMTLSMSEMAGGLAGGLEYATDLFDARTIDRYARALRTLARGAVEHPETPISLLPLLAPEEEAQILREWNDTAAPTAVGEEPGEPFAAGAEEHRHHDAKRRALIERYGPSRATLGSCSRAFPEAWEGEPVSLGRPVANARLLVLDDRLLPVPVGVTGEIVVWGGSLAEGHDGRPDLTAERFVPDPFGASGGRLHRTGDLARLTPRGELVYLGRRDRQVMVRGVRIDLAMVEASLALHPDVREASAFVIETESEAPQLLAAAVLVEGKEGTEAAAEPALRGFLAARLPAALVPAHVKVVPSLPRTANGGVDRRALASLAAEGDAGPAPFEPPRTAVEQLLASLWSEVLGLPLVGRGEDFFAAGGHSLIATRVLSRLRASLGVEMPLRDLFEAPTLGRFAARVEQALGHATGSPTPQLVPIERTGEGLALSFAQERLWFLDQIQPDTPLYNMPAAHVLHGGLSVPHLAAALSALTARHETLRTVFGAAAGAPVQIVLPAAPVPLPVIDLRALSTERRLAAAGALAAEEAGRPFDLARGPLLRATLLALGEGEQILLLTQHHIVSDAWSMEVLVRELTVLYAAFAEDREAGLPPLPVQYADFAAWQRGWLAGPVLEHEVAEWRERLTGLPARLELPADHPRPAVQSTRGGLASVVLPGVAEALGEVARRHGATPFMVLLGAFQALLSRLSGQDDLAVGSPVAGRNRLETEGLIGFFVNTLVLRARTGEGSFGDFLGRVREAALFAYAHQDLPFEKLVEELNPPRSLAWSPLFQVLFSFEVGGGGAGMPAAGASTGGPAVGPLASGGSHTAKFDLSVVLRQEGKGISGVAEYGADLFDPPTVARWLAAFGHLVEGALADPGRALADLPLLGEAERHQLGRELTDTAVSFPAEASIPEVFAEVAARYSEAPAVEYPGASLTYGELAGRAGALAEELARAGAGPETPVALLLPRSAGLIIASLAVLQASGAYVPLDPTFPRERLAWQIADCGATLAVVAPELLPLWQEISPAPTLLLDAGGSLVEPAQEALAPVSRPRLGGDALAYVLYTSGSTGRPKGVAISHRGVLRLALENAYGVPRPGDRVAQIANPIFDATTFEIWGALLNGGTVVGIEREITVSPADFAAEMAGRGIDRLFLTTSLFHQVADHEPAAFAGVREMFVGGETLDPERVRRVLDGQPPASLANVYGPTENTTFSTWHRVHSAADVTGNVPIGRPISNSTLYVADSGLALVPPGVAGEILLGGPGLARGYAGRPDLTAERFVPDPWGVAGGRLYRTGDRARQLPSGVVEFLGRFDGQVKLRGFRIELAEIEAALLEHPAVRQAAVLLREDRPGDPRLVAYASGEGLDPSALRASLTGRLPAYMLPSVFVLADTLPLSPTGKIDRRALPAPEGGERTAAAAYVEPETARERAIAAAVCEILGIDRAGREDNFFDLGGHSLLLVKLASLLTQRLERPVSVIDLFRFPSVAALADHLGAEEPEAIDREVHEQRAASRKRSLADRRDRRRTAEKGGSEDEEEWS